MINLPPELVEIAKLAVPTAGALVIFKQSLENIAGATTDEIIGYFQDASLDKRRWRQFERQVKMFIEAQELLTSKGLQAQSVPLKSLVPILEGVKLEEDESMRDKWTSLLTNSASGVMNVVQLPSFSEVLRILSPAEAALLDSLYAKYETDKYNGLGDWSDSPVDAADIFQFQDDSDVSVVTESLIRQRLIVDGTVLTFGGHAPRFHAGPQRRIFYKSIPVYEWEATAFGAAFVKACQPPNNR